jgi:uncharacterized membrane protein YesL
MMFKFYDRIIDLQCLLIFLIVIYIVLCHLILEINVGPKLSLYNRIEVETIINVMLIKKNVMFLLARVFFFVLLYSSKRFDYVISYGFIVSLDAYGVLC